MRNSVVSFRHKSAESHRKSRLIGRCPRGQRCRSVMPHIIAVTLRHLCRDIQDRDSAMTALNRFCLDELIYEILREFPGHDGIHKWGWRLLWHLSYPRQAWRPSPRSIAVPVRKWRNSGGSWVIRRRRKKHQRRMRDLSRVYTVRNGRARGRGTTSSEPLPLTRDPDS